MGFLHNLVADIPDNYQNTNDDDLDEPKPKKRRKPNPPLAPSS